MEENCYSEGGETLTQITQRSCGCPILEVFKGRLDGTLSNVV